MGAQWVYVGGPSGADGTGGIAQALAVHAVLLPAGAAGKIIYFAGSEWVEPKLWEAIDTDADPEAASGYAAAKAQIDHTRIYDCFTQTISNPGSPNTDVFCCGHTLLADGRLLVAGGTQHWPTDLDDPHEGHWSGTRDSWFFDANIVIHASPGATVTALWAPYQPDHLDIFMSASDGTVWSTWWTAATGWQPWFPIAPGVKTQLGAPVTALWAPYQPDHLDLFMSGPDGTVWSTWWTAADGWQPWFPIDPNVKAQPGAPVTALWAPYQPDHLDLFMSGPDGTVWSTWWTAADGWQPWFPIDPNVKAQPGAPVTALWAPYQPDHLDLFMSGPDGTVSSTWWTEAKNWQAWFSIDPNVKAQPGAPVTALWAPYQPDHLDLFMSGPDGTVWSTWWTEAKNWQAWFSIDPNVKAQPGAPVTALWAPYQPDHLDLFMSGPDGTVWSTWWTEAKNWQAWFSIDPTVKAQPGANVTALWAPYQPDHLDLFMTEPDGTVLSTWWSEAKNWQAWFGIWTTQAWSRAPSLNLIADPSPEPESFGQIIGGGRWYPTLILLSTGQVFAHCGHPIIEFFTENPSDFDPRHNNTTPEVFDPVANGWSVIDTALGVSEAHDYAIFYPRIHMLPNTGSLFVVQPLYSSQVVAQTASNVNNLLSSPNPLDVTPPYSVDVMDNSLIYDVSAKSVTAAFPGPQTFDPTYVQPLYTSQETTSVMLPLLHEEGYAPRILICGAVQPLIVDLSLGGVGAQWTPTSPRRLNDSSVGTPPVRYYANSTLLPTGGVLISGGVLVAQNYTTAEGVRTAEIYQPAQGSTPGIWTVGPAASETRGYHSVALLMPDGRVWTAGSEEEDHTSPSFPSGQPNLSIELFEPGYYGIDGRATILESPSVVNYGQSFVVTFIPPAYTASIARVALLKNGSATHGFDGDQRYVSIPFVQDGAVLTVTAPPDATVAPPGFYMLWLIDTDGMPCRLAPFVQVLPASGDS